MTTVIIEDEIQSAKSLKCMIEAMNSKVIQMLYTIDDAVVWFTNYEHPDLIFLNVKMNNNSSLKIFDKIRVESSIVFMVACNEADVKILKSNNINYLFKPVNIDDLKLIISKFESKLFISNGNYEIEALKSLLNVTIKKKYKKIYTIRVGQHIKVFNVKDVVCFYSENNQTYLLAPCNRSYLMNVTLSQLQSELDPNCYFKANCNFLINRGAIGSTVSCKGLKLKLKLKDFKVKEVIVSDEKIENFNSWLESDR